MELFRLIIENNNLCDVNTFYLLNFKFFNFLLSHEIEEKNNFRIKQKEFQISNIR